MAGDRATGRALRSAGSLRIVLMLERCGVTAAVRRGVIATIPGRRYRHSTDSKERQDQPQDHEQHYLIKAEARSRFIRPALLTLGCGEAEQHCIVPQVDELFALADEAVDGGAAEEARQRFLTAALVDTYKS